MLTPITDTLIDDIPLWLRAIPRWILWRSEPRGPGKKPTKRPVCLSHSGRMRNASTTDPSTWDSFDEVVALYAAHGAQLGITGLGFVLNNAEGDDPVIGLDLDGAVEFDDIFGDAQGRLLSDLGQGAISRLGAYWEWSPSGTGAKAFLRGDPGRVGTYGPGSNDLGVELYPGPGRFFTVTGRVMPGSSGAGADATDALVAWAGDVLPSGSRVTGLRYTPMDVVDGGDDPSLTAFLAEPQFDPLTVDQVRARILPYLELEAPYEGSPLSWISVGMALHDNFQGSQEGFDLWREAFSRSSKFDEDDTETRLKWNSFKLNRGGAAKSTIGSLLKATRAAHDAAGAALQGVQAQQVMQAVIDELIAATTTAEVERIAKDSIAGSLAFSDVERAALAGQIQQHLVRLGVRVPIATARNMVKVNRAIIPLALPDIDPTSGYLQHTEANLAALLHNNGVTVRYNVTTKDQEILIPSRGFTKDNRANASLAWLGSTCAKASLGIGAAPLRALVTLIADTNQYNPVLNWITSKPWDGVDRIQALADTIVERPGEIDPELKKRMLTTWLVQGVVAGVEGGRQVRGVLVFQGGQYKGKSRWLGALAPQSLGLIGTGLHVDPHNKDTVKQALSFWLTELGELDATFKKSDMAALKGFLSRTEDVIRLPYAAAESKFDRRTVFFGTVNDPTFLNDPTGNTRFWSIPIQDINHEHDIDTQQLWAQVYDMVQKGALHYPTPEDMAAFDLNNEQFVLEDPVGDAIRTGLDWDSDKSDWVWMTSTQVMTALRLDCRTPQDARRGGVALRKHTKWRSLKGYTVFHVPTVGGPVL